MSTRLVLARHGESEWHHDNRYAGVTDIGLTDLGLSQGRALGRWAAGAGLSAVWTSPQRRAHDTAVPASEQTGLGLRVDERLRELDFGVAEGLTRAEMATRLPEQLASFRRDPVAHHFDGGEDPRDAARRYAEVLAEIVAANDGGRVLVVAHSTALRLALCALVQVPLARYRTLFPHLLNCALTEVRLGPEGPALLSLNQVLSGAEPAAPPSSTPDPGAHP
jgi:probable phosphoglycerate mutase